MSEIEVLARSKALPTSIRVIEAVGHALVWRAPSSVAAFVRVALTGLGRSIVCTGFGVEATFGAAQNRKAWRWELQSVSTDPCDSQPCAGTCSECVPVDCSVALSARLPLSAPPLSHCAAICHVARLIDSRRFARPAGSPSAEMSFGDINASDLKIACERLVREVKLIPDLPSRRNVTESLWNVRSLLKPTGG